MSYSDKHFGKGLGNGNGSNLNRVLSWSCVGDSIVDYNYDNHIGYGKAKDITALENKGCGKACGANYIKTSKDNCRYVGCYKIYINGKYR